MPEFDEHTFERVISTSQENARAIAESLNLCFDRRYRVEICESLSWDAAAVPGDLDAPGLLVAFQLDRQGLLCFVPESLPLPEWYTQPSESQQSRLQTLAMEWSLNVLPLDLEASQFRSLAVDNLKAGAIEANPAESAGMLELLVFDEPAGDGEDKAAESSDVTDSTTEAQPIARIYLLGPVMNPPFETAAETEAEQYAVAAGSQPAAVQLPAPAPTALAADTRTELLSRLPVTVAVRLAEKKIELGTLLSLTPGALIAFDKSCEDLLDLFVNDRLYCRGEAVKIGEKFGLKINKFGAEKVSEKRVINT